MPQDRQLILPILTSRRVRQSDEVEHQRIHYFVGKCVLFVKEDADEKRIGSRVIHRCKAEKGRCGVKNRNRHLGKNGSEYGSFFQRAARLKEIHQLEILVRNIGHTSQSGNKMPLKKAAGL